MSLWDCRMKECTDEIVPINTFILSSLIQEFADKVKRIGERLSDVSTAALLVCTTTVLNRPNKSLVMFDHRNVFLSLHPNDQMCYRSQLAK